LAWWTFRRLKGIRGDAGLNAMNATREIEMGLFGDGPGFSLYVTRLVDDVLLPVLRNS
jgi:hypothetical protein